MEGAGNKGASNKTNMARPSANLLAQFIGHQLIRAKVIVEAANGLTTMEMAKSKNCTMRMGAYMVAINRICTAGKLCGGPI